MAAEIAGVSTAYTGNMTSANHSYTFTVPGDTEYLLGIVGFGADRTVIDFDVDAQNLTELVARYVEGGTYQHIFDDEAPPTGTDLTADYDFSSDTGSFDIGTVSALVAAKGLLTGASPVRGTSTAQGDGTTATDSITTEADDLVIAVLVRQRAESVTTSDTGSGVTEHINAATAVGDAVQEKRLVVASRIATGTSTSFEFTGAIARDWTVTLVALQPPSAPDPATLSREPADIAAQEQTDTTAHVRIDSVDTTAGNTSALWGHTSNLGADAPATWEASATQIDSDVTTNDLVAWASRSPNTTYYFAVVTTDSGSNKTQSAVLSITTAYAKPTSPTVDSKTDDSVTVSATDASSGAADHQAFYRESTDPLSALQFAGTIPAGETIQFTFTDLTAGTEYSFEFVAWDGVETESTARYSGLTAVTAIPDATAPVLSSATDAATGGATGSGSVSTDEGNGTLYWVVTTSATSPSAAQVKAGQDHAGSAAADSGSQAVGATGVQNVSFTGLTSETQYFAHYMHEDDAANQSSVASADGFTTDDVTAPVLSSPTATATGATTADLSVSTDEGDGTLYWVVTESVTAPSAAQVQAGQDDTGAAAADSGSQAVSATGTQEAEATGLTAETTYYAHFQQEDAATNDSTVATSASFTTDVAVSGLVWPAPSQEEGNIVGSMLADQIAALGIPQYAFGTAMRAALAELIAATSPSPPTTLDWPDPAQEEGNIVGSKLSDQITSLGIPAYAFATAIEAALAEVIALSSPSPPTTLDWPDPGQDEGNIVGSVLSNQIAALGIPQYAFETAIRAALAEYIAS